MIHLCKCINAPMGKNGLEGYAKDEFYLCQDVEKDKNGNPYYRIYPDYNGTSNYYETCGTKTFNHFFRIIETAPTMKEEESIIDWLNRIENECPQMNKIYNQISERILTNYIES